MGSISEDLEQEILAIESIYECNLLNNPFIIPLHHGEVQINFKFLPSYPMEIPEFTIKFPYINQSTIDSSKQLERECMEDIQDNFHRLFQPGEVVLFEWIEWLKDYLEQSKYNKINESELIEELQAVQLPNTVQYPYDENGYWIIPNCPTIYHSSEPTIEKKSIFIAHVAKVMTLKEIKLVRKTLLSNTKISRATHNIAAYRIVEPNGVVRQDGDDDGETAAGARLLHLLQLANAENVYVVVSRWYGGVQLGPSRFKYINNCARDLLVEKQFIN
ncbi:ribosomal protein S5 domain 2-type protein [Globomyces pollinis-pini]|nr:ribosomal protein S5 domain 2-type protein [Globomyces pollinis-pini]